MRCDFCNLISHTLMKEWHHHLLQMSYLTIYWHYPISFAESWVCNLIVHSLTYMHTHTSVSFKNQLSDQTCTMQQHHQLLDDDYTLHYPVTFCKIKGLQLDFPHTHTTRGRASVSPSNELSDYRMAIMYNFQQNPGYFPPMHTCPA